jgi:DNA polymerase III delta prime subunit
MDELLSLSADLDRPLPPESQALLDRFKQYAVQHPRLLEVETALLHTIWEPADVAFVVVCGPSGAGKTTMAEHLAKRLNASRASETLAALPSHAALLVNTRPPDGELFNRIAYYRKGLLHLGRTTFERRVTVDIKSTERTVESIRSSQRKTAPYQDDPELCDAYEEELRRQAVRVVIMDEVQHLMLTNDKKHPKDQLNWIKSMTTETSVLHILVGPYELLSFCNLDGQMARRGMEIHFRRYQMENESDCQSFRNALASLLKHIPLHLDPDPLIQRWWYFFEGSLGCIGVLKQWLVRALYRALREGSPQFTLAHIERCVLPDAKWARMDTDIRSGEAEFQYADGHRERQLRVSACASRAVPTPEQTSEASSIQRQDVEIRRPIGKREPRRDAVGTLLAVPASHSCSFSGPIDLDTVAFVQSAIQVIQCPACGAVRKAKLQDQHVVVLPHPPVTKRAVRNISRWQRQGTTWVCVSKTA